MHGENSKNEPGVWRAFKGRSTRFREEKGRGKVRGRKGNAKKRLWLGDWPRKDWGRQPYLGKGGVSHVLTLNWYLQEEIKRRKERNEEKKGHRGESAGFRRGLGT